MATFRRDDGRPFAVAVRLGGAPMPELPVDIYNPELRDTLLAVLDWLREDPYDRLLELKARLSAD